MGVKLARQPMLDGGIEIVVSIIASNAGELDTALGEAERQLADLRRGEHIANAIAQASVIEKLLTPREQQVAKLVLRGLQNKEIARELGIALSTVTTHIDKIYTKLGVSNRLELASRANGNHDENHHSTPHPILG